MLADLFGTAARAVQVARGLPVVRETMAVARHVPGIRQLGQVADLLGSQAVHEIRELADRLDGRPATQERRGGSASSGPAGDVPPAPVRGAIRTPLSVPREGRGVRRPCRVPGHRNSSTPRRCA